MKALENIYSYGAGNEGNHAIATNQWVICDPDTMSIACPIQHKLDNNPVWSIIDVEDPEYDELQLMSFYKKDISASFYLEVDINYWHQQVDQDPNLTIEQFCQDFVYRKRSIKASSRYYSRLIQVTWHWELQLTHWGGEKEIVTPLFFRTELCYGHGRCDTFRRDVEKQGLSWITSQPSGIRYHQYSKVSRRQVKRKVWQLNYKLTRSPHNTLMRFKTIHTINPKLQQNLQEENVEKKVEDDRAIVLQSVQFDFKNKRQAFL